MSESRTGKNSYEKKDINVPFVIGVAVFLVFILIGILIGLNDLFISEKEKIVYDTLLKPESTELLELQASQSKLLSSYKVLDAEKGIYQIPINRAMTLVADEYAHKGVRQQKRKP